MVETIEKEIKLSDGKVLIKYEYRGPGKHISCFDVYVEQTDITNQKYYKLGYTTFKALSELDWNTLQDLFRALINEK